MGNDKYKFGTLAIHAGQAPDPKYGAINVPIYQTSTYVQKSPGQFFENYDYSRVNNPTREALEKNIAALEGGRRGLAFSSGLSAIAAIFQQLKAGDHIVLCDDVYGGTYRLLNMFFKKFGLEFTVVDMTEPENVKKAIRDNTKLVFLETPTNPLLKIIDIRRISEVTRERGVLVAVDNTFATPYLQRPLEFGADIVAHSTTKYLAGHSDLVGGMLVVNDDKLAEGLHLAQYAIGAVPGVMDCYLTLRSTKTLHLRMDRHCRNAEAVANFLAEHPKVEKVLYPGLESHPQHSLAKEQMSNYGGMVSFYIKGTLADARRFLERTRIFSLAESLGGVESLVEHPAIMTHASVPEDQRNALGISDTLIRLSVGVEDSEDLISDLKEALE
ncbi:MAG: cystathionine gamma-synthase [Candidatus Dadabacteria bacterium]|nr:MAG: cystathionine gamma-synthase [Candidatus Dadabacteria bacterium]